MENSGYIALCILVIFLLITLIWNIWEVKLRSTVKTVPFSAILVLVLLILSPPLLILIFLPLLIHRQIVWIILKIRYGSKFEGLLRGVDAFHVWGKPLNSVVHCLMIIQDNANRSSEEFFDAIKKVAYDLTKHAKFTAVLKQSFGYSYMLNDKINIDDCIKTMDIVPCRQAKMEKDELLRLLNDCANKDLPGEMLWQILVGLQPVEWKTDENKYYPVMFRFHHVIGDGVTINKCLFGSCADMQNIEVVSSEFCSKINQSFDDKPCENPMNSLTSPIHQIPQFFVVFFKLITKALRLFVIEFCSLALTPSSLVVNVMLKAIDKNILHGPPLTGQKLLALKMEKSNEYFYKIKRIKNEIPGTSFPDVLVTAFSASLHNYFLKHSTSRPEYITVGVPVMPEASELPKLIPGELDINSLQVDNKYSLLLMSVPLFIRDKEGFDEKTPLLNRLKLVTRESNKLRSSFDYQINYVMMFLCGYVPHPIVRFNSSHLHCTSTISVLPGTQRITYSQGTLSVVDSAFWVPLLHGMGTSFSVFTYDDRLQVGFSVDKGLISDENAAQTIVDEVYENLDLLEQEIFSLNTRL